MIEEKLLCKLRHTCWPNYFSLCFAWNIFWVGTKSGVVCLKYLSMQRYSGLSIAPVSESTSSEAACSQLEAVQRIIQGATSQVSVSTAAPNISNVHCPVEETSVVRSLWGQRRTGRGSQVLQGQTCWNWVYAVTKLRGIRLINSDLKFSTVYLIGIVHVWNLMTSEFCNFVVINNFSFGYKLFLSSWSMQRMLGK